MEKIKLSSLLEFWKNDTNNLKLDKFVKEQILKKTVYRKSIFSYIVKYSVAFSTMLVIITFYFFYTKNDLSVKKNYNSFLSQEVSNEKTIISNNIDFDEKIGSKKYNQSLSKSDKIYYITVLFLLIISTILLFIVVKKNKKK